LLKRDPPYPKSVELHDPHVAHHGDREEPENHLGVLFDRSHIRATLLACVPWFLQDLSTYGIGIFTPVILAATIGTVGALTGDAAVVHKVLLSAQGTMLLDVMLVIGIVAAISWWKRPADFAAGRRLHRLRRRPGSGGVSPPLAAAITCRCCTPASCCSTYDQHGTECADLPACRRGVPNPIRGYGAGFAASVAKIGAVGTSFGFRSC